MNVREIEVRDCENLTALSIYVWLDTYAKDGVREEISKFVLSTFTKQNFKEVVTSSAKRGFVVTLSKHIIGTAIVNLDSHYDQDVKYGYEIETLYVHPGFQRRGVGALLLGNLRDSVGEKSWLTTWVHNYGAINFYKKNGYNIVGEVEFKLMSESHMNHVFSNVNFSI